MRAPEWTEEQRRAIERRSGELLLDAAAGSGKTAVLVERFARSVLEDGIEVGAILTITFTEKAAGELRERIRARLVQAGASAAARAAEGAFISTIHGFCARVLRTHALAAGLDPRFEVLDAERTGPLQLAAFDAALETLAARRPPLVELIAAYGVPALRGAILGVHEQLRSLGHSAPALPSLPPAGDGRELLVALRAAARALLTELGAVTDPGVRIVQALQRAQRVAELPDDAASGWPAEFGALVLPRNGGSLSSDACVAYGEALVAVRAHAAARAAGPIRDELDALLHGYGARYAAAKAELSAVDFTDLELLAAGLLRDDAALREGYAERFAAIMVDELQDTNRVQLGLIESIARDNLFTVGDAQQSIYGFRHADVELFRARGARLQAVGARETLRTNFRTRPEIVDVLNPAFAQAMGDQYTPLRAGRPAGEDAGADGPRVELLVADKGADWDLEGIASPWRLAEARLLAGRVAELVAGGTAPGQIVLLLRASTDLRAYERALEQRGLPTYVIGGRGYWGHPQVLDMVAYLSALANPREEEALYGVLVSPLVGISIDALVILAAAARAARRDPWSLLSGDAGPQLLAELEPGDARALAAFSAWFGAERAGMARRDVEELLDSALERSGYDLAMLELPGGRRRLANVRKLMRLGREHAAAHGPDLRGFLDSLAERAASGGAQREGEAPVEGEGLDAIRLMTIHRSKGLEFDVVCVADLGRSPRPPATILRTSGDGRLGLRLARAGVGGRENALEFTALGAEARAAEEQEERRLFYVAMTRARERLVLSGAARLEGWLDGNPRRVGGGPIAWIAPAFVPELPGVVAEGGGVVAVGEGHVALTLGRPSDAEEPGGAADVPGDGAGEPASPAGVGITAAPASAFVPGNADVASPGPVAQRLSYSALSDYARCGYRFYAERVLGLPAGGEAAEEWGGADESPPPAVVAPPVPAPPAPAASDGRRRGVLAHALLERLDFRRPVLPPLDHARAAAARAGLEPPPGPEELDGLAALVRGFAASELCARLARAGEVRREQRFAFPLRPGPAAPMIVGALDVIATERTAAGERRLVVDYKTDRLGTASPQALVARGYADQQLVYALAALADGADEVQLVHCFLEAPSDPVSATFTRAQAGELRERLGALAAGVLAGRFPVAPDPRRGLCAGCPAQGGLCSWPLELTRRESADTLF